MAEVIIPLRPWTDATPEQRVATATAVFHQKNGDVTKDFYAGLNKLGLDAQLAVALFRAQKRSEAAKSYRGKKYRGAAYEVKDWSIGEVCRILTALEDTYPWGWARDERAVNFENVLYVDLPTGQVSYHCPQRHAGPDYAGVWVKGDGSREHILRFFGMVGNG